MKVFVNKRINNTTRVVSLLGLELYKTEDTDDARTQYFLGNFIYTKKIKSKIKELKTYKIFNFPISTRIIEDDIFHSDDGDFDGKPYKSYILDPQKRGTIGFRSIEVICLKDILLNVLGAEIN